MRKKLLMMAAALLLSGAAAQAQSMSDSQVVDFIRKEVNAGTSQSQIVTKLVQRGVKIDQIRRVRAQYEKELNNRGLSGTADAAVEKVEARMRSNNSDTEQDLTSGRGGSQLTQTSEAVARYEEARQDVKEEQSERNRELSGMKVFGRDIFNNRLLSFEPNMNIATPQDYVLGPGDQLIIDIYGASQKSYSLTVSPEGTVTVPGYGPVQVSGLTVAAAQSKVRSGLGSRYSSSDIRVTVGQTRTIMISVMGEVKVPGNYHLSAFASVFHALYVAGGINNIGTLRNIKVFRGGRLVTVVDVYEYILHGRLAGNIRLKEGDVIQVGAYDCIVGVTGNVKRPMFYEMRPSESVKTLLEYAGGMTGDAYRKSVRLTRFSGDRYGVYNIDEFDQATFRLTDGDAVEVDGILNRYDSVVEIRGAVFRPGQYRIGEEGVTTVRSLIEAADGLTEDAFAVHAVLRRLRPDRSFKVLSVDVAGIMNGTVADIPLENEDELFIPTQSELIASRLVTISGEVLAPGDYPWAENLTIEDLVMQAGGLTDAASVVKVDVSRRIKDPKSMEATTQIAQTFTFALKDGFVVDGTPGFLLEPYDVVQVRRSPGFHTPRQVSISGEVTFAGGYTMEKKNQRLSDLVKMAGGVTKDAYVEGARLVRRMNDMERSRRDMALQTARQSQSSTDSVSISKLALSDTYTVGIHLEEALKNPGGDADIVLRAGDQLIVPEYESTVKISGDVMYSNTVTYEEGRNYKWYVKQAGGYGQRAKKSKAYVLYPNGTMALAKRSTEITPGCEIIVPSKPKRETLTSAQWVSIGTGAASIISSMAMIYYVLTK
ncbi:MAG: SLBB domain-containing protein [Prevotella sp.]|nr:SLBB domain-containing protein [Prevotella sp.]